MSVSADVSLKESRASVKPGRLHIPPAHPGLAWNGLALFRCDLAFPKSTCDTLQLKSGKTRGRAAVSSPLCVVLFLLCVVPPTHGRGGVMVLSFIGLFSFILVSPDSTPKEEMQTHVLLRYKYITCKYQQHSHFCSNNRTENDRRC